MMRNLSEAKKEMYGSFILFRSNLLPCVCLQYLCDLVLPEPMGSPADIRLFEKFVWKSVKMTLSRFKKKAHISLPVTAMPI